MTTRDYSGYEYRLAATWPKGMGRRDKRWPVTTDRSKVEKQEKDLLNDIATRSSFYAEALVSIEERRVSPWGPMQ